MERLCTWTLHGVCVYVHTHIRFPATVRSMHTTDVSSGEIYIHICVCNVFQYQAYRFISFGRIVVWRNETSKCTWCLSQATLRLRVVYNIKAEQERSLRETPDIYIHTHTPSLSIVAAHLRVCLRSVSIFWANNSCHFIYRPYSK